MFKGYSADKFYDEMFLPDGKIRDFCGPLHQKFQKFSDKDFLARKTTTEASISSAKASPSMSTTMTRARSASFLSTPCPVSFRRMSGRIWKKD